MKTTEELKEIILDLRLKIIKLNVPKGHCPYAYYNEFDNPLGDCSDCSECKEVFMNKWEEIINKDLEML